MERYCDCFRYVENSHGNALERIGALAGKLSTKEPRREDLAAGMRAANQEEEEESRKRR